MLPLSPESQCVLSQSPIQVIADLVAIELGTLRNSEIGAILQAGEANFVSSCQSRRIGYRIVGTERWNGVQKPIAVEVEAVHQAGRNDARPGGQWRVETVERGLPVRRCPQCPAKAPVVNVFRTIERVPCHQVVLFSQLEIGSCRKQVVMHKCGSRSADNCVGRGSALAHRDSMALVTVFGRYKPKGTVLLDRSTDRAAELFADKMWSRKVPAERGLCLQRLVPQENEA